MRIVFNKNYDSQLSKEMLAMTNIEIVQVNPENGQSRITQRRQAATPRDILMGLELQSQRSEAQLSGPRLTHSASLGP